MSLAGLASKGVSCNAPGLSLHLIALLYSYYEAYNMIRRITGVGKGQGPIVVIHEGFRGIAAFNGFMPGADRLAIDREHLPGCSLFTSD